MFACGSGISPFIPLINKRNSQNLGKNYLFFGCRNPEHDDIP